VGLSVEEIEQRKQLKHKITLTWWWPAGSYDPSKFKIYRALKTEQTTQRSMKHEGWAHVGNIGGNPEQFIFKYDDIPPDDRMYFYKIESDHGVGGLGTVITGKANVNEGGSNMVTGQAKMIAPPPLNVTATVNDKDKITVRWDQVTVNSPRKYFINQAIDERSYGTTLGENTLYIPPSKSMRDATEEISLDFWFMDLGGGTKGNTMYLVDGGESFRIYYNRSKGN
jgi:hypothetical protein